MASPWDGKVFELVTVNFQVESPVLSVDALGNPRFVITVLPVVFKPRSASKKYRDMVGIAPEMVMLDCRCVEPMELPDTLHFGSSGGLTIGGVAGVATIEPIPFSSVKAVNEALGTRVFLSWRSA
jgi:hypothetical protein